MGVVTIKNIKTGVLTSEFWLALATTVTGVLVTLGYLSPEQSDEFVRAVVAVMGGLVTITSTIAYLYGRVALKREQIRNGSPITTLLEGSNNATSSGASGQFVK